MNRAESTLKVYKRIQEDFEILNSSGHYALIYASMLSAYDSIGQHVHKENIKQIITQIIDHLWSNSFEFTNLKNFDHHVLSVPEPNTQISKSKSIKTGKKNRDIGLITNFSYHSGPSFGKEKKMFKVQMTPGPCDYSVNLDITKNRSPNIVTPKSKKLTYEPNENPGPGAYTPLYRFRATR